jgi:hypothetical protein
MKATIITTPESANAFSAERKVTDLSKPGNRKWLMSHIKWAVEHRHSIVIQPSN